MYVRDAKPGNPGKLSGGDVQEIIRRFNEGETIGALSREYGVSMTTVRYHLNKARNADVQEVGEEHEQDS